MVLIGASGEDPQQANRLEVMAEDIVATAPQIEWFHGHYACVLRVDFPARIEARMSAARNKVSKKTSRNGP